MICRRKGKEGKKGKGKEGKGRKGKERKGRERKKGKGREEKEREGKTGSMLCSPHVHAVDNPPNRVREEEAAACIEIRN